MIRVKIDEVMSVGTIAQIWANYSVNRKALKGLQGKHVLVVNEKQNRICGLVKFLKPPKEHRETVIYTEKGNRGGEKL